MDINEYRNRGRRRIELPSGMEGYVRQPNIMDLASYPALVGAKMNGSGLESGDANRDLYHCILRRCFIPDGGEMTDKEPGKCLPGELSVCELETLDANAIFEAVNSHWMEDEEPDGEDGGGAAFQEGAD